VGKVDLSKSYQNPKRNLGVTTHFSEIIELKFGKKLPHILCILTHFVIIDAWLPTFFFFSWIPITLAKTYFVPIVITFAKIQLY